MDLQKAHTDIQALKQEKLALQKQLDESSPDLQSYVPRVEHEQVLDELVTLSATVTKKIESNKDASQNASQTKEMPPSDALHEDSWTNVDLNIFDNTIDPHHLNPMLSTADGLPLANLDNYEGNT